MVQADATVAADEPLFAHPSESEFARILERSVRDVDLAGRWGGEEFMLVLPGTDAAGAVRLAERIRDYVEGRTLVTPEGVPVRVTASFGAFPRERMNPNGGSVAIGHPFGATGARILSQAVKELAAMPSGSRAIVSICADGGQGTVALLESA